MGTITDIKHGKLCIINGDFVIKHESTVYPIFDIQFYQWFDVYMNDPVNDEVDVIFNIVEFEQFDQTQSYANFQDQNQNQGSDDNRTDGQNR